MSKFTDKVSSDQGFTVVSGITVHRLVGIIVVRRTTDQSSKKDTYVQKITACRSRGKTVVRIPARVCRGITVALVVHSLSFR